MFLSAGHGSVRVRIIYWCNTGAYCSCKIGACLSLHLAMLPVRVGTKHFFSKILTQITCSEVNSVPFLHKQRFCREMATSLSVNREVKEEVLTLWHFARKTFFSFCFTTFTFGKGCPIYREVTKLTCEYRQVEILIELARVLNKADIWKIFLCRYEEDAIVFSWRLIFCLKFFFQFLKKVWWTFLWEKKFSGILGVSLQLHKVPAFIRRFFSYI